MLNISRKFPKISKNVIYAHRYIWSLIPVGVHCYADGLAEGCVLAEIDQYR